DGIRDGHVTGVQTCALPISISAQWSSRTCGSDEDRRVWPLDRLRLADRPLELIPPPVEVEGLGLGPQPYRDLARLVERVDRLPRRDDRNAVPHRAHAGPAPSPPDRAPRYRRLRFRTPGGHSR